MGVCSWTWVFFSKYSVFLEFVSITGNVVFGDLAIFFKNGIWFLVLGLATAGFVGVRGGNGVGDAGIAFFF